MCPDTLDSRGTCANNVTVMSGESLNRLQCVSFIRPFETGLLRKRKISANHQLIEDL